MDAVQIEPTVGRPKDLIQVLEQRLALTEEENQRLLRKLSLLTRHLAELEGRDPQLALDALIEEFRESEAERLRKQLAGLEAEAKQKEAARKAKPRRGHGPTPQPALPVVTQKVELSKEAAVCTSCGGQLEPMGEQFEESEEIHVLERQYVLRVLQRQKYRCRCNGCVATAPAPPRVIPGGRYSTDFIVQVAADKWLDNIPLERQVRIMSRHGLETTSQALFDQADAASRLLLPTYERLGAMTLEAPVLHADETRWPMIHKKGDSPWTVWTRTTPEIAHFAILSSKSRSVADTLFDGYQGTIVADGYEVYESLARDGPNLDLANCWAHVRRKFDDQLKNYPIECTRILDLIRELYDVEDKIKGPFPGDAEAQRQRLALREAESKGILEKIWTWTSTVGALPRSEMGKNVRYMLKRKEGLSRFLGDARIPLDNNAAERSLRGPVIGRKVFYGSKSKRGTKVAAIFYTLFETAKLNHVDPVAYLKAALEAAMQSPGAALLPWEYRPPERPSTEPSS
ncbi:MAG: IS66 family transposase [Rhodospirillales bacterium]|nr:IS66 family transposase [Rhodospirillales bacterium]